MKPEERKLAIVEAAIECFSKGGYHATSISHIIEAAGIARGTFYLYFKSKHEIFQFILDDLISRIRSQIHTIDLNSDKSPAAQMRGNVERVVSAITSNPEVAQILFNEAVGLDDETQERLKNFYAEFIEIIQSAIKRGTSFGLIRNVDPSIASCIALGGVREIIVQKSIFKNADIDDKSMIDGLIDVLFGGIGPKLSEGY